MPAIRKGKVSRAPQGRAQPKPHKQLLGGQSPSHSSINLWGIAGRREIMEMRRLWQMRIPRPHHPKG